MLIPVPVHPGGPDALTITYLRRRCLAKAISSELCGFTSLSLRPANQHGMLASTGDGV